MKLNLDVYRSVIAHACGMTVVSEFRAALDLDHRYCSLCAERAKPGRGKPVLIMRIGFFACFHAISLETQSFQQNRNVIFHVLVALAYLDGV